MLAQSTVIGDTFSDSYRERAEEVHRIRGTRAAYLALIRSQYSLEFVRNNMLRDLYEEIAVPVLQLHGTLDQSQDIESARELLTRLADTRFVAIDGSDHFIHIEAPDRWVEEVTKFVESLAPSASRWCDVGELTHINLMDGLGHFSAFYEAKLSI